MITCSDKMLYDCTYGQNWMLGLSVMENFVISVAVKVNHHLDKATLLRAVNIEIMRNEGLRFRLVKQKKKTFKQYMESDFTLNELECYDMRDAALEEVQACVNTVADKKMNHRKDRVPFKFVHFIGPDDQDYLLFKYLHIFCDAYSTTLTLLDTLQVYWALSGLAEMPKPLSSVTSYVTAQAPFMEKIQEKAKRDYEYYEKKVEQLGLPPMNAARKGGTRRFKVKPGRCSIGVPKLFKPADMYVASVSPEITAQWNKFCFDHTVSPNSFILTGVRTSYSAVNNNEKDVSFCLPIHNRSKQVEKRLPFLCAWMIRLRTIIQPEMTFAEAAQEVNRETVDSLRHMWCNWADQFNIFKKYDRHVSPLHTTADMTFSKVSTGELLLPEGWTVEGYWPVPKVIMDMTPIYLMVIDSEDKGLKFCYRYMTDLYRRSDVEEFHWRVMHALTRGIEDPALPVGELLKDLEKTKEGTEMCNDILKNITERISKYVFEPIGSVSEDARLIYDLGLSDISAVCMIEELEKKYNIEIPDKAFADIVTVGDVVRAIEASMA